MKQLTDKQLEALRTVRFNVISYIKCKKEQESSSLAPKPFLLNPHLPMALQSQLVHSLQNGNDHETLQECFEWFGLSTNDIMKALNIAWSHFMDLFDDELEAFSGISTMEINILCIMALDELEADQITRILILKQEEEEDQNSGEQGLRLQDYCDAIIKGIYPARFRGYIHWEQELRQRLCYKITQKAYNDFHRNQDNKYLYDSLPIIIEGNPEIDKVIRKNLKQIDPRNYLKYYTTEELESIYNQCKGFIESDFESYKGI